VIGKLLKAGHFGEVYLATDVVHGAVAVKVLRQFPLEPIANWRLRKTGLLREAQRLKQATHPNVVQVFNLLESESSDAIHLVMEYCSRGSLQEAFEQGPMSVVAARKLATEVVFGLRALHARGMLHRDIKPGNLLVSRDGIAKLGDFGLVTDNLILGYGSQAGYSDHIAPEVWNGSGTTVRSDIWALGMTLYRLLHGAEWYSRMTAPRAVVRNGGFADTLKWLPHITPKCRRFIRKMLKDEPGSRYQNTNQVLSALASLETDPDWHCSVTPAETRWELERRRRRTIAVWEKHGPRSFTWRAWSEPLATGNRRSLGGSSKRIGHNDSERQLRDFFVKRF
jgi:eukaryotic-like serine/threonine-protein kinase